MKKTMVLFGIAAACMIAGTLTMTDRSWAGKVKSGEALFQEHCQMCHMDGGNIINPKKTLNMKDLAHNKIKTADDIVKVMRKPGPGMTTYDEKTISNVDAKEIGKYILKTFGK